MGVLPVIDGQDFDAVAVIVETDPIIAEAKRKFGWVDALQSFQVFRFGGEEFNGAHIGSCLDGPAPTQTAQRIPHCNNAGCWWLAP